MTAYKVFQVKRPITKLYRWAQGGGREEGRVLPFSDFAQIFVGQNFSILAQTV
jgi:hypothetical protein